MMRILRLQKLSGTLPNLASHLRYTDPPELALCNASLSRGASDVSDTNMRNMRVRSLVTVCRATMFETKMARQRNKIDTPDRCQGAKHQSALHRKISLSDKDTVLNVASSRHHPLPCQRFLRSQLWKMFSPSHEQI